MEHVVTTVDDFFDRSRADLEQKITATISDKDIVFILQDGKRLRPLLAHLAFKACTQGNETPEEYQKALEGAVSIELAHTASLVHDDIIDNDKERRGKPSFHITEGIAKALVTGHKMLSTGFNIALKHSKEVADLYVQSWDQVVNGELDEVSFNADETKKLQYMSTKSQIFEAYNKIIDLKTAVLFSSACKAGAIEANMTGDVLEVFGQYGREIGLAYQLADDLVDLACGEMIDSVIIPLVHKLEQKTTMKKVLTKRIIKKNFSQHEESIRQLYLDEIKHHVQQAEELSKSETIPHSPYKQLMTDAPAYIINRMLKKIKLSV